MGKKTKLSQKTTYAFIDSQNLNLGVKSCHWQLDFSKFRVYLNDKFKVDKAFLFIGYVPNNQKLYAFLKESGYICIFKPTLEVNKNKKTKTKEVKIKGNVDAELVLQAMIEMPNYNQAIIVSGDGDFHCLIRYLKSKKKLLKILVPNQQYSSLLRKFASHILNINLLKKKLEVKKKP